MFWCFCAKLLGTKVFSMLIILITRWQVCHTGLTCKSTYRETSHMISNHHFKSRNRFLSIKNLSRGCFLHSKFRCKIMPSKKKKSISRHAPRNLFFWASSYYVSNPIVRARWSLSGMHQHWRLGVKIPLRVRSRKKYILLFSSKWKFRQVERTFLTPSRQRLNRFGWNLASVLSDSFSPKLCLRIMISFFVLEYSTFFHLRCRLFVSSNFICSLKTTNAIVKNLRHRFLL